MDSIQVLVGF